MLKCTTRLVNDQRIYRLGDIMAVSAGGKRNDGAVQLRLGGR